MKKMVIRAAVAVAIFTSFTVTAEAKPVTLEPVSSTTSISITSTSAGVGVLAD